jgi:DNA-binding response OmpR family regulator
VPNRVLVVDDDPLLCELIQEVLRSDRIEAHALTNSAQAAARLREEKFDAVFLDVRMPPPDGMELARQMRASGLNQKTPIVMITGEEDRTVLTRGFEAGATFLLFKPVDRQSVLRLIHVVQGPIERERRRFTRVKAACKVSIELGEARLSGTTLDLSLNGMLVQAGRALPLGSLVKVNLELTPGAPPIRATARVARVVGADCIGLQLEGLGMAETERLQEFLLPRIAAAMAEKPSAKLAT